MKLNTVNVITLFSGMFSSIHSFTDDVEGNTEAEALFVAAIRKDGIVLDNEDALAAIEEGYFEYGKTEIFISHSGF